MVSVSPETREEKFYKRLEPSLTTINNDYIAMNPQKKSFSVMITMQILDELIERMKCASKLFEWLFNRVAYVGSYYDGLRVKEASEFDINIVLKLPLVYDKIKIVRNHNDPGFVSVNFNDAKLSDEKLVKRRNETEEIWKWLNKDGYLSHWRVLRWWESVFSKVKGPTTVIMQGNVYKITAFRKAGPAMTAHISGPAFDIDVDLVSVIEFPKTVRPPSRIRWPTNCVYSWFLVPKKMDNEILWRVSFPEQEKKIMNGLNKLKVINRFIKRVRDAHNWGPLASYYIKNIFLWEAEERRNKGDVVFFNKNMGYLFVYFLGKLQIYLEQGHLPFFWDKQMNLFVKIGRATLNAYAGRIKNVRAKLETLIQEEKNDELTAFVESVFHSLNDKDDSPRVTLAENNSASSELGDMAEKRYPGDMAEKGYPMTAVPDPIPKNNFEDSEGTDGITKEIQRLMGVQQPIVRTSTTREQVTGLLDQVDEVLQSESSINRTIACRTIKAYILQVAALIGNEQEDELNKLGNTQRQDHH